MTNERLGRITPPMFRALALSIAQLGDPVFLKVFAKSLALTIVAFILFGLVSYWALIALFDWWGWGEAGGLAAAATAAITAAAGAWLLFRAAAMAVIGLFTDEIVAAVEARHYPDHASRAIEPPLGDQLRIALGSAGRAIGWNLLAAPLYIALLVTGVGTVLAFFAVNALLLARDLGELVAQRHIARPKRRDWLRRTRGRRMQLGLVSAGLFVVPVVNLFAPVLSAAMSAHMLHGGDKAHA